MTGFKSFARKTNVVFRGGITAIVGPNGCGKSNIVDAIRWVMGEQRSGALRSDKMENVIFNGSESARPVGMSEVSLKMENNKNLLPIDHPEVVITRRLFRSGESQYFVNGSQCRLKDIVDLFMDTGVGPGTYSVIELAQVERLLNGKEEERRKIFEEAAGITKYKLRRKATFRKLEATEKDLIRVEDIISEVDKSVRSLKRQVEKAQRFQKVSEELKKIEIVLATYEYNRILTELEPLKTKLSLVVDERESASSSLAQQDSDYEATRAALLDLEKKITAEQTTHNEQVKESQKFEERILVNSERIRSLEEAIARNRLEGEGFSKRLERLNDQLRTITGKLEKSKQALAEKNAEYNQVDGQLQELRKIYEQKRDLARATEAEYLSTTEELGQIQNEGERLKAAGESLSQRLKQIESEEKQATRRLEQLENLIAEAHTKASGFESTLNEHATEYDSKEKTLERHRAVLESLQRSLLQEQNKIDNLENQAELLKRIIENYDDYPAGVKFLSTSESEKFSSYGPLANLILVQHQYRSAIAAALGEAATFLLVENSDIAFSGIGLLQQEKKGVVSFLPLKKIKLAPPSHPQVEDLGVVGWASELVRTDKKFQQLVDGLLGSFLVVQDIQTAHRIRGSESLKNIHLVTLTGEVLYQSGRVKGGSYSKSQSELVGRNQQLESLEKEITALRTVCEERQGKIASQEQEIERLRNDLERLTSVIKKAEDDLSLAKIEVERLKFEHQSLIEANKQRTDERRQLSDRSGQLQVNLEAQNYGSEDLQAKRKKLAEKASALANDLAKTEQELNDFAQKAGTVSVKVAELKSDYNAMERECDSVNEQIRETESLIAVRDGETAKASNEIDELKQVNEEYQSRISSLKEKIEASQKQLDELTDRQYETNAKIAEQEKSIKSVRSKSNELSESVHQLEMRVSELRLRAENLKERMWEEFECELQREAAADGFNVQEARESIEKLRNRIKSLGPVNLLALKEFEQEKERLDFLLTQKDDLLKAKRNLTETIDIINNTARERFMATFEQVQKNFAQVFSAFFAGGRASLVLREGNDPLESEIDIYATPGGKRLASLQLMSGGEKSLTAISLLFAIYLVKPSPFCIFDEVDAPLDDENVIRFSRTLKDFTGDTQFIVVTHNKLTMRASDQLYGVTMAEKGVSKVVSVTFDSLKDERLEAEPVTATH
ncbi:chromosome segregation protein SMC [candidate division KSB1 bacterium RBG_16_48_16]|nr:MAG: chromosome segregation protein SMC [candidate division KSB1 bacterium RBG_16_48_16]